eukprot:14625398-Alexandrium_andersonii.AAC.1
MDTYELHFPEKGQKVRFVIFSDVCTRFVSTAEIKRGPMAMKGTDSGQRLVEVFCTQYLQHRPRPLWIK